MFTSSADEMGTELDDCLKNDQFFHSGNWSVLFPVENDMFGGFSPVAFFCLPLLGRYLSEQILKC